MDFKVYKEDIDNIGNTMYEDDGYLNIICSNQTFNIEEILLRNILLCWGDYSITEIEDFYWEGIERPDVRFATNLPYDIYEKEMKKMKRTKLKSSSIMLS